ncbi:MAG TPA: SPOR domain-containing protein [Bacteroidota bacterium]|nr:SPOR domain-containing protein [Bacteroidota bacterium]
MRKTYRNGIEYLLRTVLLALFVIGTMIPLRLLSQDEGEIRSYLERIDQGGADSVRKILPDLIAKYQNTPGIMYLQGRLATDGIEAVKFYQGVVDNFPKSEWASDALYRIYQYYYALGLYKTADLKMQQLKKDYPNSIYVTGKPAAEKVPKHEPPPVKLPTPEPAAPDTQQNVKAPAQSQPQTQATSYVLQTGAFSTLSNAQKQKNYFQELGYSVDINNKIRGNRSLYLVWVGGYKSVEEARAAVKEIRTKYNVESIIVQRY